MSLALSTLAGWKEQTTMTKAEGAAISELLSVAEDILERCLKEPHLETITIDKFQKQRLMDGYTGVMSIISGHRRSAEEKLTLNKLWMSSIRNRNHQLKLTDEKGNALEEPTVREVLETAQVQTIMDQIDSGVWADPRLSKLIEGLGKAGTDEAAINPEDGEQLTLEAEATAGEEEEERTVSETFENGAQAQWALPKGVPDQVISGLTSALRDGATRAKACDLVAREIGLTPFEVKAHFQRCEEEGIFVYEKERKAWIAHLPTEREPSSASIG